MLFFADSTEAGIKDDVVEVNGLVESLSREAGELRDPHPSAVSSKVRYHVTHVLRTWSTEIRRWIKSCCCSSVIGI
jgi:hypothetical protein